MTDYDKACKILIDRCEKVVKNGIGLDSHFWQSKNGNLVVKTKCSNSIWCICILNKYKGHITQQAIQVSSALEHEIPKSFSSQDALSLILDYAKDYDIYVGWNYMGKILSKNDTLENLLVEYDMKY